MGDIPGLVKISVSLKIQPNDGAVYFKVDGQRFGQNRTIKLLTGAKYKIEVALRPGTVQATTMGIGGVNVPLEEKSRDAQVASYTGIYDTEGVPHTKSGERQPIQVNMQISKPKEPASSTDVIHHWNSELASHLCTSRQYYNRVFISACYGS
ncbi:CB1 cannabinoid receptor-interacting protein 1 isoform X3 [Ciconia boyciana]|uniref:CB1 cannabinoid receptor-interacting protein 1 isoform X3 n=1 Tax=Ciconia boyciana TaxID=52775 RepID=UPI003B9E295F